MFKKNNENRNQNQVDELQTYYYMTIYFVKD